MERRRSPFRAGLLTLLLVFPLRLFAQELEIRTEAYPDIPVKFSTWTFVILVDHPNPGEVTVRPPVLPAAFFQESSHTGSRVIRDDGGPRRRWTALEYRFKLNEAGTVTLGPFEIRAGGKSAVTEKFTLTVEDTSGKIREVPLVWEHPPYLETGKASELLLRTAEFPRPDPGLFNFPPPEGFILERGAPSEAEKARGLVLRLRVIPLKAADFFLPEKRLEQGDAVFISPPLRLPVHVPEKR
jgi:hypothetical protein